MTSRITGGIEDFEKILGDVQKGNVSPVYTLIGERPVTRPLMEKLTCLLVPEESMDLNFEFLGPEDYSEGKLLELLETVSFFPGRKVVAVQDPPFLLSAGTIRVRWKKAVDSILKHDTERAASIVSRLLSELSLSPEEVLALPGNARRDILQYPAGTNLDPLMDFLQTRGAELATCDPMPGGSGEHILSWLAERSDPDRSVLMIQAEVVDRKLSVFRKLTGCGPVLDMDRDRRDRKKGPALARNTVIRWAAEQGKKIENRAVELLLQEVGHESLTALRQEMDKLTALAGDRTVIREADVRCLAVRYRDEALYQLTGAIGDRDRTRSMKSLALLLDQEIHPLAVLQTITNHWKKMMLVSAAAGACTTGPAANFTDFRNRMLPEMIEFEGNSGNVIKKTHPYALFKLSRQASGFRLEHMLGCLAHLAEADFALKGSSIPPRIVLETLIYRLIEGST
ncbi:MAG TPA: hypothetical protein EYP57_06050 [Thermodesulfobacteriaceae bacterium]|nr:hypothetical protein [Thermodesulfobacteriaceae bacterium]